MSTVEVDRRWWIGEGSAGPVLLCGSCAADETSGQQDEEASDMAAPAIWKGQLGDQRIPLKL